jgi:ATP-binding cassette, subfamily B, bacterial
MSSFPVEAVPDLAPPPSSASIMRRGATIVWQAIRAHPGRFGLAIGGANLYALMAVGGSVVLGRVTDEVISPGFEEGVDGGTVAWGAAAILVVAALRAVGAMMRRFYGMDASLRMQKTWFGRIVDKYLAVPLDFFGRHPTGTLLAHADADIERAVTALQPVPMSIGVVVLLVAAVGSLAAVDPLLMLVGLALFPTLGLLNRMYARRIELPAAATQDQLGRVSAVVHESFDGALVVKTLGLEDREHDRLAGEAEQLRQARLEVGWLRATFEPGLETLPVLGSIVLLAIGSWRVSSGALDIGGLVQAMALFGILAFPTRVLGYMLEELPRAVVAADRLNAVLANPARARPADGAGEPLPAGALSAALSDVTFGYAGADAPVLEGCTLRVEPGEVVALVGATGSGKTSLCLLLAHLYDPGSGVARVGDVDLAHADPVAVRRSVALAFQEPFLFVSSLRENLTFGDSISDDEVAWALEVARADRFVAHLPGGLDHVVGERGVTLSGGQRQRLALARALLRRPGLLLLDDATSAVDPVIEQQILANLRRSLSTTTLVVAHRLSTIALADRVLFLQDGRIAASGPHAELVATVPAYAALAHAYEQEAAA